MIRVECYLAVLKSFKQKYPQAHFEVMTRTAKSPLSPSQALLDRYKQGKESIDVYFVELEQELRARPAAMHRLKELEDISKEKDVFLVCYEKDPSMCHRSLVKRMMEAIE
ncbi:MAG TPA: DUF488 domain-containing protein [Candidatus Lokiarchaeia archaeon]|nr:DUF488 domain-containing protein [Candidatus Lokiarchaeia archaeon]